MKAGRSVRAWASYGLMAAFASAAAAAAAVGTGPGEPASGLGAEDPDFRAYVHTHELKEAEARLSRVTNELRRLETRTRERGRVFVRMMRLGLLPLSDGFEGMAMHASRAERLRRAVASDLARATELKRAQRLLRIHLSRAERQRHDDHGQILDYQQTRQAIEAARERELAYRRAFEPDYEAANEHTAVYAAAPRDALVARTFADARGRLLFPVKGRSEMKAGSAAGATGPGLLVSGAAGAEALSVFGGTVILAGDYGQLGLGVVVDHGGGYTTLTAGLADFVAEVGERIPAGATLGHVPHSGELYIEVRHQGAAIEPAGWFGI